MASLEMREPPTFLSLPPEIRLYICSLSGCLQVRQFSESPTEETKAMLDSLPDFNLRCTTCSKWTKQRTPLSPWVNRNSVRADDQWHSRKLTPNFTTTCQRVRKFAVNCKGRDALDMPSCAHSTHIDRIAQSAVTKVNKQTRQETLPVFYGSQSFLFTLFDQEKDSASVFKWLRTIGKQNARFLKSIKIVYRKKKVRMYIMKTMLPIMNKLGVRTEAREGVMMAIRLEYPFCYCEACIRRLLGEG